MSRPPLRILFVCTGNICRSPTAEGVCRQRALERGLADRIEIDSAGTHAHHVGEAPDGRACDAAERRGVDLSRQRARQVQPEDFSSFDLILAMDRGHYRILSRMCLPEEKHKVRLFMDFAGARFAGSRDVPDPYYGGLDGFDQVMDMVEAGVEGMLSTYEQGSLDLSANRSR